ncbi:MAG: hypothetical protein A2219_06740 [Elusimicrobia bacterium RIFOXYA2_FULL_50_26]|nr:MAG: hypothetical protein A2219_06740 [Elusimicrobia bacterium RIFOXYA2_FULL_50_26]OGS23638.1 MAG: hypothetical protein A2314_07760 [Elusimicrobia bacterium RIFOXYB2_FULL_50_12]
MGNEQVTIVLAYHRLFSETERGDRNRYNIPVAAFARQMEWLRAKGFAAIRLGELLANKVCDGKRVLITFDDGDASNYHLAMPLLGRHGFNAVFFITADVIGKGGVFLNAGQLREMTRRGHYIESHGGSHRMLTGLPDEELRYELARSRSVIGAVTGVAPETLSCPGGRVDSRVVRMARETGFRMVFSSKPQLLKTRPDSLPYVVGRYMVTTDVTQELFEQVASMKRSAYLRSGLGYHLKNYIKMIMGDSLYQKLFDMRENME